MGVDEVAVNAFPPGRSNHLEGQTRVRLVGRPGAARVQRDVLMAWVRSLVRGATHTLSLLAHQLRGGLLSLALAGCVLSACVQRAGKPDLATPSGERASRAGQRLELSLQRYPTLAPWTLASARGKVVLLDTWATWCEPCRDSLPLYEDFQKEFGASGLEVIALSTDDDPLQIPLFLSEAKVDVTVMIDPHPKTATHTLGVNVIPTSYLIDRKGTVRFVHEGFDEGMLSTLLSEIQLLVEEAP